MFTLQELQGFGARSISEHVLKKTLYGLEQAGRLWKKLLHIKLTESGYGRCDTNMCVHFKVID